MAVTKEMAVGKYKEFPYYIVRFKQRKNHPWSIYVRKFPYYIVRFKPGKIDLQPCVL